MPVAPWAAREGRLPIGSEYGRLRSLPPGATTLFVRNIPTRFAQERLLQLWPQAGTYDFLYAPCFGATQRMKGFAFVNFVTPGLALEFQQRWHGTRLPGMSHRGKPLDLVAASTQGRAAKLKALGTWKADKLGAQQLLPVLFSGAERLDRALGAFVVRATR